jgi:hypothetical protein
MMSWITCLDCSSATLAANLLIPDDMGRDFVHIFSLREEFANNFRELTQIFAQISSHSVTPPWKGWSADLLICERILARHSRTARPGKIILGFCLSQSLCWHDRS